MTVKFSERNSSLKGPLEYIKIIKLYLERYFLIRPSNFIFTIFSKVYHTFGTRGALLQGLQTNRDYQENQKEILNNPSATAK